MGDCWMEPGVVCRAAFPYDGLLCPIIPVVFIMSYLTRRAKRCQFYGLMRWWAWRGG